MHLNKADFKFYLNSYYPLSYYLSLFGAYVLKNT